MEIYQLELFLGVLQAGSLTQAAKDCGLSAGAISQQMQKLSSELGTPLFLKSGRGLALSPAGRQFAERARKLLGDVEDLRRSFSGDVESDTAPFHLATGATTFIHALSRPLRSLHKRFPQAEFRVTIANTEEMVEGIIKRRFDLALISLPIDDERLQITPLYEEELLMIQPSDKPFQGWRVGNVKVSDLAAFPYVLYPESSNMRNLIDQHFQRLGHTPRVAMEAADTEVIIRMVEAGLGQSILPAYALRRSPRFFRVLRHARSRIFRQQAIATLRRSAPRPLLHAVSGFLKDALR
jgi:DNA-binding transcriptional LysR family regulator